jgi:hypothetical protein
MPMPKHYTCYNNNFKDVMQCAVEMVGVANLIKKRTYFQNVFNQGVPKPFIYEI